MMLEHNTPIEISNPTVRSYWIQYYRSVCRIVSRIPIGFLSDHRIWEDSDRILIGSVSHPIGPDIGLNHLDSRTMAPDAVSREFPEKTLGKLIVSDRNQMNPVTRSVHRKCCFHEIPEKNPKPADSSADCST
jgi:hypothetical protein